MATATAASRLGRARGLHRSLPWTPTLLVAVVVAARLPFLHEPLGNDEAGYAYVAAQWSSGQGQLYGGQWVDRPPLLIALFAAAYALAGEVGVRLLGAAAAAVTVAACWAATARMVGRRGATWSAAAAAALVSNTLFEAQVVNAELLAIAFTSVSMWLVVLAWSCACAGRRAGAGAAVLAGAVATCAVLVKQSLIEGFVFGAAFLLLAALASSRLEAAARVLAAALVGVAVVAAAAAAWAEVAGPGVAALFDAMYVFRVEALGVIEDSPPEERAERLALLAAVSGLLPLYACVAVGLLRVTAQARGALVSAVALGVLATAAYGAVAVALGGNWWSHYLIQLVPPVAIGAGLVVAATGADRRSRGLARLTQAAVVATVVVSVTSWVVIAYSDTRIESGRLARAALASWLREASQPGDTLVVAWGQASILLQSGLETPYPYAWSLPVRVRDPELRELHSLLGGERAPAWIVRWHSFNLWGLDRRGRVRSLVSSRYERVATVCEEPVYLRRDLLARRAPLPPPPSPRDCGAGLPGLLTWAAPR